jgi:hypothetical protein
MSAQSDTQNVKVGVEIGGDRGFVKSGGTFDIESGGTLAIAGIAVTATATEMNQRSLHLDIADGSAEATYYLVSPFAGTISKIYTVIDDVVSTANITVTGRIGITAITNGVVTIATASSAPGDVDEATPTAANAITAGAAMNFVVTGGGSGGAPRIHLVVIITL